MRSRRSSSALSHASTIVVGPLRRAIPRQRRYHESDLPNRCRSFGPPWTVPEGLVRGLEIPKDPVPNAELTDDRRLQHHRLWLPPMSRHPEGRHDTGFRQPLRRLPALSPSGLTWLAPVLPIGARIRLRGGTATRQHRLDPPTPRPFRTVQKECAPAARTCHPVIRGFPHSVHRNDATRSYYPLPFMFRRERS